MIKDMPKLDAPIPDWLTFVVIDQYLTLFPGTSRETMIEISSSDAMAIMVRLIDFWNLSQEIRRQGSPLSRSAQEDCGSLCSREHPPEYYETRRE